MRQGTRWIETVVSHCMVWCVCLVCLAGVIHAGQPGTFEQPDTLNEPIDWDVLPNGLLVVQYDSTGDGVPDDVTLHQITWSGWTAQPIEEIEAQARQDDQWVFIVDYDRDRFVYFAARAPLFAGDDHLAQVPFLTKEP